MAQDDDVSRYSGPLISESTARTGADSFGHAPAGGWAALVPELSVSDMRASLPFWRDLLGFHVAYDRPAARFAYLVRGALQVMLCERNGRWETADMQRPFGRGINLQKTVDSIVPLLDALSTAGWPLYEAATEVRYRVGESEHGVREFLVQDPDGYLLRFGEAIE